MARYTGTTTQRGYGHQHQQLRERRLGQYKPGDPCAHCHQPLTYWPLAVARRYLDLPHNDQRTGYLAGMAHRACNRRDGQRKTSAILRAKGYQLTPRQRTAIRAKQARATANRRRTLPAKPDAIGWTPSIRRQPSRW